ncbi:hypothetical protein MFIFM68171_02750 [Madurella fahalii]|uniref:Uncharacterized protein n=1 Tax=Madurella fahalii TaxID=1157608 RepID=A0ABQ0G4Q3_9PEZI
MPRKKAKARKPRPPSQQVERKQRTIDYFDFYIRGAWRDWTEERRSEWQQITLPRYKGGVKTWPGITKEEFGLGPQSERAPSGIEFHKYPANFVPDNRAQAYNAARELAERLGPHQLRFVKMLGWGGQGMAALFERLGESDAKAYCVAKCRLDGDEEELKEERKTIRV